MAYFDSEKNKALWEKRMTTLRGERDRRKLEGYRPEAVMSYKEEDISLKNPSVRVITLKELMAKEAAKHAAQKTMGAPEKKHVRQSTKELSKGAMDI